MASLLLAGRHSFASWKKWLVEDKSSRPFEWLKPDLGKSFADFVSPSLMLMLPWSGAAGAGLLTAYKVAGSPCPQGDFPFLGRGEAVIRLRLVGGRAPGRLHRPARVDAVDVDTCESFIDSSLAPVILFRRRLRSVGDVRNRGFTTARWQALMLRWAAVCRQGPVGPIVTLEPWSDSLPQDLHGFFQCFFDSLDALNVFVKGVVVAEAALASWKRWLKEDKSSRT